MHMQTKYTQTHAKAGIKVNLPKIATWKNQYKNYEIIITISEFTSVCPKTGLPDFGTITIRYMPDKFCAELKSFKTYMNAYRNLGIFQENSVNKILEDFVKAVKPIWGTVTGEFNIRGGMKTTIQAEYINDKT